MKIISMNAMNENIMPNNVDIDKGTVVNAIIPSIEYEINHQNDQLVSPAALSMFSYSIHFVS